MTTLAAARSSAAGGTMPLAEHLREARRRLLWAAAVLVAGVVAGWLVAEPLLELLRSPVTRLAESRDATLNYDSLTGAFDLRLRLAVIVGLVLSGPFWIAELLAFVAPGLTRRERRYVFGFLGAAVPLFLSGCALGFLVFPHMVELLAGFASADDATILSASSYVDFVQKTVLASGTAFVLPVLLVLLNFVGLLPARTMLRSWRVAVVGIVVFSALVTPSADVLSMFAVAAPICALFFAAVAVAALRDRTVARRAQSPEGR